MQVRLKGKPKRSHKGLIERYVQAFYRKQQKKYLKEKYEEERKEELKKLRKEGYDTRHLAPKIVIIMPDTYKEECKECEDNPRRHGSAYCQECSDKANGLSGTIKSSKK